MAKDQWSWTAFKGPLWILGAFVLVGPIKWLFDNLGYAVFVKWLHDKFGIEESGMIALLSANLIPIVLTILLVLVIYRLSLEMGKPEPSPQSDTANGPVRDFVQQAMSPLSPESVTLLRKMLIAVQPAYLFDPGWAPLERAGLVERNQTGAKGITESLRPFVSEQLNAAESPLSISIGEGAKFL